LPPSASGLAARREALRLLSGVLRRGQPLEEASRGEGDQRDQALARAIATTTLRRLGQIEARLGALLEKPLPRKSGPSRDILATAAAQILFMRVPAHAAIDLAVTLAREDRHAHHFSGLINAVLRRLSTALEEESGSILLNTPEWLRARWRAAYGPEALEAIAAAHLEDAPLDLSVRDDAEGWAERLGGIVLPTGSVRVESRAGAVETWPGYEEGVWWVQDAAAALPARLLGDVRGKRVLDLCAAPGGKTAELAAAGAEVTALDRSPTRMRRLEENLSRLKLAAETVVADALDYRPPDPFDAVLLDAPCSSTGTIRRHPDIPYLKTESDIAALASLQRRLLDHAATLVVPGGLLVYATCSLEPEEGEEQARWFLAGRQGFERAAVGAEELAGLSHFIDTRGDLRTLPFFPIGGSRSLDGFFAARFRRI